MNKLVYEMKKESATTLTDNGAKALNSTLNNLVSLYGTIGAMRFQREKQIIDAFNKSWTENPELTLKMVFHARDIQNGMGERKVTKILFKHLANIAPETMKKNIIHIPSFGRWDDLYCLVNTPCEQEAFNLINTQFKADMEALDLYEKTGEFTEISLLGKWLKSVNTTSKESRLLGIKTMKALKMREKEYRSSLARLRNFLNVVETKMSSGEWETIKYSGVTSKAMSIYRKAFMKHDAIRFQEYLNSLIKGETKINASTLFPYEILEKYDTKVGRNGCNCYCNNFDIILEEQWKSLPNYVEDDKNVLIMADTSGSMAGRPLMASLSLAIYFAERNKGEFKNIFMTFDKNPNFIQVKGQTLKEKIENIKRIDVANTNIEKAFDRLLEIAKEGNVPKEDMPKALVIISDMQFDRASSNKFYYDLFVDKFTEAGYEMPNVIFWNVNAQTPVFHAVSNVKGVQMASGSSPTLFKSILNSLDKTPLEAVLEVLNSETYKMIVL